MRVHAMTCLTLSSPSPPTPSCWSNITQALAAPHSACVVPVWSYACLPPQDSVYYHPTLNPTGHPPPGKAPMYHPGAGNAGRQAYWRAGRQVQACRHAGKQAG